MDLLLAFDGSLLSGDLAQDGLDLKTDTGLQTAIVMSLFTDRRADDEDELPAGEKDRRGWWGDMLSDDPVDRIGSRLWLLSREKQLSEVLARAEEYAVEALQWLMTDGHATALRITATNPRRGLLALRIDMRKADGERFEATYTTNYTEVA